MGGAEPARTYPGLESNAALVNPFEDVVERPQAQEYQEVRPRYPAEVYDVVLTRLQLRERDVGAPRDEPLIAVDIGAGTGQFTQGLVERDVKTIALEPSGAMRNVLVEQPWAAALEVVAGTGEETGLPDSSVDLVTWAQCAHWLDVPVAAAGAARILRHRGMLAVIANQLDVSVPWVHRLSRIMRSGDVVRAERPPKLGGAFEEPMLTQVPWVQELDTEGVLALGRTRSSYLQASAARREKMQENLHWYLSEHMGFDSSQSVHLPYVTFVWVATLPVSPDNDIGQL